MWTNSCVISRTVRTWSFFPKIATAPQKPSVQKIFARVLLPIQQSLWFCILYRTQHSRYKKNSCRKCWIFFSPSLQLNCIALHVRPHFFIIVKGGKKMWNNNAAGSWKVLRASRHFPHFLQPRDDVFNANWRSSSFQCSIMQSQQILFTSIDPFWFWLQSGHCQNTEGSSCRKEKKGRSVT